MDFDYDSLIEVISDILTNGDYANVSEHVSDVIGDALQTMGGNIELDPDTYQKVVDYISTFVGGDSTSVSENLDVINKITDASFSETGGEIADGIKQSTGSDISFTSICWDECYVTVGDHGKRLACGYNL